MKDVFDFNTIKIIEHSVDFNTGQKPISIIFTNKQHFQDFQEALINKGVCREASKTNSDKQKELRAFLSNLTGIDLERFVK